MSEKLGEERNRNSLEHGMWLSLRLFLAVRRMVGHLWKCFRESEFGALQKMHCESDER